MEDNDRFRSKTPVTSSSSEPVSSCQSPFSDHHHSPSFTQAEKNQRKKLQRKSACFAYRIREHVRLGNKFSETVKGKLSIGAKIIKKGGRENIFTEIFGASDGEKLLKASQCYLSTTVGPIAGILFVSTQKIAFCSERSIHFHLSNSSGGLIKAPYKFSSAFVKPRRPIHLKASGIRMELSITRPDDWHLHLRDGDLLEAVVNHSSQHFGRAIVMPNLRPPITTTAAAVAYRQSILKALPENSDFTPLMTLYLTDTTSPDEIKLARESGVVFGVKLYPAGATTNSQDGVTDLFGKCLPVLEEMIKQDMPLLVHGEVTNPDVDVFDRERVFIDTVLRPLLQKLPRLKVVMEHITTKDAADFVLSCDERFVAATVTPQHLVLNRNALFQGGLQPHSYCLPVLKRETHRQAIVSAVTSGSKRFFLGTDSAPHERTKKECPCGCAGVYNAPVALSAYAKVFEEAGALDKLEAFTSFNGPDFYGLPRNSSKIKLSKTPWTVPASFSFAGGSIVPMFAGQTLEWLPSPA